jgi:hypothetical protein
MKRSICASAVLLGIGAALTACSPAAPTEKTALNRCQSLARDAMPEFVGNPLYRVAKSKVEPLKTRPDLFEYNIKGEYLFKAFNSGDSELRSTCQISKAPADAEWTTVAFDSICVGGCT